MAAGRMAWVIALAGSLAACDRPQPSEEPNLPLQDPAMLAALDEPILVDPDLVGLNQANQVASLSDGSGILPTVERGDKVVSAARAEALELVGGSGAMLSAPEATVSAYGAPLENTLSAVARASASPGVSADCAQRMGYTMMWAARLPATFPIYPRGAVQEAAGIDAQGCALRSVNFETPVPPLEVIDLYYTLASAAKFSTRHVHQGGETMLSGGKRRASYAIYARELPNGNTSVDLVLSGF